jgi:chaperonin GroEL (HSP60 family)
MSSKLIHNHKEFFKKMVVDAVLHLDQDELNQRLIGMKKVPGGGMQDSMLIDGVAFKKTFAYAGFEQQPKSFKNPIILSLNVELELKAEKDNAEVRIEEVSVRTFVFNRVRNTKRSWMLNGKSFIISWKRLLRPGQRLYCPSSQSVIWLRSISPTEISSVPEELEMRI